MSQVKAGSAYVELSTRNAALMKGLADARRRLQDFAGATRAIGMKLFGVGAAAAAPMAASMAVFSSFDDAIRGVRAVTQATERDFVKLRDKAKQLGATTSYSATQVASLMTELGRAGFTPDQIIEMTGAVMDLARATGTDATRAAGIMSATIRQFGLAAEDAGRVADGLTAAANKSFNSVESLGEALKYAGPIAADTNMSLEETLAILGSLGNMGIQGSNAGSALRRLLTLNAAQAKKFQEVFGVATMDAAGNMRPLVDVLGDVAAATNELPSGERAAKFAEVFGMLGITSAGAIGKSIADTRRLYEEIKAAGGAASSTAKEMESGIGGSFRILKSSLEGVSIAIGEALSAPLQRMTQALSGTLSAVIKWIEKNSRLVRIAAATAAGVMVVGAALIGLGGAFAVAGMVIGGFLSTMSLVSGAIAAGGAVIAGLLSPIGLVSLAVLGLGGYLTQASGIGGAALVWLGERFAGLKSVATESFGAIGKALAAGDIGAAAKILWLTLRMEWLKGSNLLLGIWHGFKDTVLDVTDGMIFGAAGIISDGWAAIEAAWIETIGFLADTWSLFTGTLAKTWHSTVGFIRKAWVRLKGLFDSDIDVDAEVRRIDDDTAAKNQAAGEQMLGEIGRREQQRNARRDEIANQRQGRADALAEMRKSGREDRRRAGDDAIRAAADDLAAAKRQWKQAVDALNASDGEPDADAPTTLGSAIEALKQALMRSGDTVAAEQQAIENKSAFNAFAIRGLGADSLADRQLRAMEQTAANTRKLIKVVEDAGLTYG